MTGQQIKTAYELIGEVVYSTAETQRSSFELAQRVELQNIDGCIVECGIAAGGNFAAMILGVLSVNENTQRNFYGFDSFEGIQLAGKKDTLQAGIGAITHNVNVPDEDLLVSSGVTVHSKKCVIDNLTRFGLYKKCNIELIDGWVQNTITQQVVSDLGNIAILRLDMDIYAPTKYTLEMLFNSVVRGGVVIIDDWELDGARIACNEYFESICYAPKYIKVKNSTPVFFIK